MVLTSIIGLILIAASVIYLLVHFGLAVGLRLLNPTKNLTQPFVSVIVSARNEEQTIGALLRCLLNQSYKNYEIIIINDRSTDETSKIVSSFQENNPQIKRIDIADILTDMPAKKNALSAGIELSKGEILCFTDADCFPPPTWIEELVRSFEPKIGLVAGYSPYQIPSGQVSAKGYLAKLFFKFIAYEEFRAAIWSAGSIGWNLGWLCTGRNLAYRRKVYDEVGGFEKIKMSISGDDDLFFQLVRRETDWKVRYVHAKESFVPTLPPANFWSFVEQRKRHFSAAKFFTFPMMLFFFLYHSSNFLLLFSPLFFFAGLLSLPYLIALIGLKILSDMLLFFSASNIFNGNMYRLSFILMEILYVLYNSLIGPLGFIRKFEWKKN